MLPHFPLVNFFSEVQMHDNGMKFVLVKTLQFIVPPRFPLLLTITTV